MLFSEMKVGYVLLYSIIASRLGLLLTHITPFSEASNHEVELLHPLLQYYVLFIRPLKASAASF